MFTMAIPERSAAQVVVALSGHSKEDADAVFGVLHACYPSGPATDAQPREEAEGHPTVWSATFEVSGARQELAPTPLGAPLTADLQGGPREVEQLRDVLATAFAVRDEGRAAGDQERELHLRLESR
ncbi:hypothetical protein EEJ42_06645 [Streptomyces botrytidirepellens]|uniref:Uncharacterized protein n=2 Tax=Streptomyces botrytidirepellens TaxID=2486417 RepID=A0A3M8WYH0_9ACTN|nr:hypothetical protein EEJ42_06645 [Streptomyces botrytidirepellens]